MAEARAFEQTERQYDEISSLCRNLFTNKLKDYGESWRVLRATSLTDQLFIKARRIRSIEEKGFHSVSEGVENEYIALVNYSLMALMQLDSTDRSTKPIEHYNRCLDACKQLMRSKNDDYGEVWRDMRLSSITDLILMKLMRIKQIEDNLGKTIASEGLEANYADIVNYAIFSLIRIAEERPEIVNPLK